MLNSIKDLFIPKFNHESESKPDRSHSLKIAACALLLEIADADDNISAEEKERIVVIMKSKYGLNDEEVNKLIQKSEEEINKSVSVYEFTDILNKNLSQDEKYLIVKNLWEIAFTDGELDKYEDYYIKKICNNLHFHNKDRISAKLEVKKELGL